MIFFLIEPSLCYLIFGTNINIFCGEMCVTAMTLTLDYGSGLKLTEGINKNFLSGLYTFYNFASFLECYTCFNLYNFIFTITQMFFVVRPYVDQRSQLYGQGHIKLEWLYFQHASFILIYILHNACCS